MNATSKSRLQHHIDQYREEVWRQIDSFVLFVIDLRLSPETRYREEAKTVQDAIDIALKLNSNSKFGRRASIYGIKQDGREWVIPYNFS